MSTRTWRVRDRRLSVGGRTLIMGVLNVTPDSFSDGGRYQDPDEALRRAEAMVEEGADVVDVGAESTRPGATPVAAEEEIARLRPVLPKLVARLPVPVSLDTRKAVVARFGLDVGVHVVNDVWGLQGDAAMAETVAESGCGLVLMHNSPTATYPGGVVAHVVRFLRQSVEIALAHGVERDRLVVDPGLGFGKEADQNFALTAAIGVLKELRLPVLVGPSRKRHLGWATGRPVDERLAATTAAVALAVLQGADIVRVHDVGAARDAARVAEEVRSHLGSVTDETVGVRNLVFFARHGAYVEEQVKPQPFFVDVAVGYRQRARQDRLLAAQDYTVLAEAVRAVMEGPPRKLLETLCEDVIEEVRRRLPEVERVEVEVRKPRAQFAAPADFGFARLEWRR